MVAPDAESGMKPVQLLSGVGVLPSRTLRVRLVLAGVLAARHKLDIGSVLLVSWLAATAGGLVMVMAMR